MTEPVLISIVLPIYNGERYLALSVQSVIEQTYPHWELIIVDDCSTDRTPEIIAEFAGRDARIRSIRHQENRKLPGALNTGFNAAQGRYFTWTSDDNIYRPHALQTMLDYLIQHPDVDLVYTDYTLIDDDGAVIREVTVAPPNMLVNKATVDVCFLYKRQIHERLNGYDETLFLIEDYDFWMRASLYFNLQPLHVDVYQYRDHQQSLTTQKRQHVMALREAMLIRHVPHLPWATKADRARGYLHISQLAREHGSWRRSTAYILKAARSAPFLVLRYFLKMLLPGTIQQSIGRIYRRGSS